MLFFSILFCSHLNHERIFPKRTIGTSARCLFRLSIAIESFGNDWSTVLRLCSQRFPVAQLPLLQRLNTAGTCIRGEPSSIPVEINAKSIRLISFQSFDHFALFVQFSDKEHMQNIRHT